MNSPSRRVRIFHIVHKDRLLSIMTHGFLWSDEETRKRFCGGTSIGMTHVKERRLNIYLSSHSELTIGQCVPFYYCPRSIMLYVLHKGNQEGVTYWGGQTPIVHLVSDMHITTEWAEKNGLRWAFTLSNAGSCYVEDRSDYAALGEIDWNAVAAKKWSGAHVDPQVKEGKQAEFLVEKRFPWYLVQKIGVCTQAIGGEVMQLLSGQGHRPSVVVVPEWYY